MKTIRLLLAIALFIPFAACSAQTEKKDANAASSDKIEAFYFHFTARCMTCKTVEAQAKLDIETLYPELVKQGKILFSSVNLDDASSKEIAEKLQISGQTLLLVKGNQKINITNEGFMYAVHQPEKFKAIIKEKIDGLL
ncbi:MAG: hypothetical protein H6Q21_1621 [Bacteroidetes bacterium]|jgi:hypothetical protein|nr:hypothetical protein [Bacteroidota bacterium]